MLPEEFLRRISQLRISDAFFGPRPTTYRINTLKASFVNHPFTVDPVSWNDSAFIVRGATLRQLTDTTMYQRGELYVQSLSSMIPPIILDPKPGQKVLDIAAAPGSKTTQMAALMQNKGEIIANDSSHVRRYRLAANLAMQGVTIARITAIDARSLWQKYPEYFDRVLADVPCSMEGRFDDTDPKSYKDWSLKKVQDLSHLQRWILRSAVSATKPGGIIVYATCTMSPEENEEVIDWILSKEKGHIVLEECSLPSYTFDPPVLHWAGKHYDQSISKTARITPSPLMEGFFIAKIRKVKSSLPSRIRPRVAV